MHGFAQRAPARLKPLDQLHNPLPGFLLIVERDIVFQLLHSITQLVAARFVSTVGFFSL
jgi:hypothetical protein